MADERECKARPCNGGPHGHAWCGRPSRFVARDENLLEWFCCADHTEGAGTRDGTRCVPVADWYQAKGLPFPEDPPELKRDRN